MKQKPSRLDLNLSMVNFYEAIEPTQKTGQANQGKGGKYKYREGSEIAANVHKAVVKVGGYTRAEFFDFRMDEVQQGWIDGKPRMVKMVTVGCRVYFGISGESADDEYEMLVGMAYGSGVNSAPDKSISVAQTQALKYAWNCALLGDAGYEDAENDRNDSSKLPQAPPEPPPPVKTTKNDPELEKRLKMLLAHPHVNTIFIPQSKGSTEGWTVKAWLNSKDEWTENAIARAEEVVREGKSLTGGKQ